MKFQSSDNSKNMLQGDKIETPQYIKENNLTPDYQVYITNQIQKPVCQIYALCVEQIPGYHENIDFNTIYDKQIKMGKSQIDSTKKVLETKQKIAYDLLFRTYVRQLENTKQGNNEITKWFDIKPVNKKNSDPIVIETDSESDED